MTIERKVGMGIAGQPSGATDVADVFSTHLYTGTGSAQTITNGIDLAGEGGMVWTKSRNTTSSHTIVDTERGVQNFIDPSEWDAQGANAESITGFTSTGYTIGNAGVWNANSNNFVSWTFRNSKKFFKAVTFTYGGSSASPTVVTHDLGCTVGMTFTKRTNGSMNWHVQHKDFQVTDSNGALNSTANFSGGNGQSQTFTSITDTQATFGAAASFDAGTYVAYFFADNSSEDAEDQMIKCGILTPNNPGYFELDLGWEPQFVLYKRHNGTEDWFMLDTMRGWEGPISNHAMKVLRPNLNNAEYGTSNYHSPISTGIEFKGLSAYPGAYIYMAIRAPMMVEPKAATDVFATVVGRSSNSGGKGNFLSGFPVDFGIGVSSTGGGSRYASSRLTGRQHMDPAVTTAGANNAAVLFDFSDGWGELGFSGYHSWMWKRAKGYMDVVCWLGNGTSNGTNRPSHSLGVVPQMIISKVRDTVDNWIVLHTEAVEGATSIQLNSATGGSTGNLKYYHGDHTNYIPPTDSQFAVCTGGALNVSNKNYISYLFATLAGISKVGSYTGNGSSQTISCGFSAGSRFILIKRTDATGDWYVWDTTRGIVAGNDPHLSLNTTSAQVTTDDSVDPHNSGFIVNQNSATGINVSSGTYIFYAIA